MRFGSRGVLCAATDRPVELDVFFATMFWQSTLAFTGGSASRPMVCGGHAFLWPWSLVGAVWGPLTGVRYSVVERIAWAVRRRCP
jgi:hypothetical protein